MLAKPWQTEIRLVGNTCPLLAVTAATWITLVRFALVPAFAVCAIRYGYSTLAGAPCERHRQLAVALFLVAALSDWLDGWVARRFKQQTPLGAFLDPLADKLLVLTAVASLSVLPWGQAEWRLPAWFAALVIAREAMILGGIAFLKLAGKAPRIAPHWSGKACTAALLIILSWVMIKPLPTPAPQWLCLAAFPFLAYSTLYYLQAGLGILRVSRQG